LNINERTLAMANSFTVSTPKKSVDEVALVKASEKTSEDEKKRLTT